MYPYTYSKYNIVFTKFALYSLIGSIFSLLVTFDAVTGVYSDQSFFDSVFYNANTYANLKIDSVEAATSEIINLPVLFKFFKLLVIPLKILKYHTGFFKYTTLILDLISFFSLFNTGLINKANVLIRANTSVAAYISNFKSNPSLISAFIFTLKAVIEEFIEIVKDLRTVEFYQILDLIQYSDNYVVRFKQVLYVLPLYLVRQITSSIYIELQDAGYFFISVTLPTLIDIFLDLRDSISSLFVGDIKITELIQYAVNSFLNQYGSTIRQIISNIAVAFINFVSFISKLIFGKNVSLRIIFEVIASTLKIVRAFIFKIFEEIFTPQVAAKITYAVYKNIPFSVIIQILVTAIVLAITHFYVSLLVSALSLLQFVSSNKSLDINAFNLEDESASRPKHVVRQTDELLKVLSLLPMELFTTEEIFNSIKVGAQFVNERRLTGSISNSTVIYNAYKSTLQKLILLNYLNNNFYDAKILYDFYMRFTVDTNYPPIQDYPASLSNVPVSNLGLKIKTSLSGLSEYNREIVLPKLLEAVAIVNLANTEGKYIEEDKSESRVKLIPLSVNSGLSSFMILITNFKLRFIDYEDPTSQRLLFDRLSSLINISLLNKITYKDTKLTWFMVVRKTIYATTLPTFINSLRVIITNLFLKSSKVEDSLSTVKTPNTPLELKLHQFSAMWLTISRLYLIKAIIAGIQENLLENYSVASWILTLYCAKFIYPQNASYELLVYAVRQLSLGIVPPFIFWIFLEIAFNYIKLLADENTLDKSIFVLSYLIYGLPSLYENLIGAIYLAVKLSTGVDKGTIEKYVPLLLASTSSIFIIPLVVVPILVTLISIYFLTAKSNKLGEYLYEKLEYLFDNYITGPLATVGVSWISAYQFFMTYLNPISISFRLIIWAYNAFSWLRLTAWNYLKSIFSAAYTVAKYPFVLYFDLVMSNYEVIVVVFYFKKIFFGTYKKSTVNLILTSALYNVLGLKPLLKSAGRFFAYLFSTNVTSFNAMKDQVKVKLQTVKTISEIDQLLQSQRLGLFSFGCEVKNLVSRTPPSKTVVWVKNLQQKMSAFSVKDIVILMKIYDSYSGYILRDYIENYILKVKNPITQLNYLNELFKEILNDSHLVNYNYKLLLFIIHKVELVINGSEQLIKNKDAYYNSLLTILVNFETVQYDYSWYSSKKVNNAALIVCICELMLYSLSKTLKPDDIRITAGDTVPMFICARYCNRVYVLDMGNRFIIKVPFKKNKFAINQYMDISAIDIDLELGVYPFNSVKLIYLLAREEEQLKAFDNLLTQNPTFYLDIFYKMSMKISATILGSILAERLELTRKLQVEIDELYDYAIRLQQKTVESNLSLEISLQFQNLAKFIDSKRDIIAANSKLTLGEQNQNFLNLMTLNDKLDRLVELIYEQIYAIDKELYFMSLRVKPYIKEDAYLAITRNSIAPMNRWVYYIIYYRFIMTTPTMIFFYVDTICSDNFINELIEDSDSTLDESYVMFAITAENLMFNYYNIALHTRLNLTQGKDYKYFEEALQSNAPELTRSYMHSKLNRTWQECHEIIDVYDLSSKV